MANTKLFNLVNTYQIYEIIRIKYIRNKIGMCTKSKSCSLMFQQFYFMTLPNTITLNTLIWYYFSKTELHHYMFYYKNIH